MCKYGTYTEVEVTIQAHLSHTGETRKKLCKIDSCIAPIVKALEEGGVMMTASCCGHGKTDGQIDLVDGRVLMILPPKQSDGCPRCGTPPNETCTCIQYETISDSSIHHENVSDNC